MRCCDARTYDGGVHINEERFAKLARVIVKALVTQGYIKAKVTEAQLVERFTRVFVDNMLEEQKLEEEAERMVDKLGRQAQGMDQRKIILGIKERLAKERGFSL